MKNFIFEWYKNDKYHDPIVRHTHIESTDMKSAVYAFKKTFGSLKKNTINFIQEISSTGKSIGDKVIPYKDQNTDDYNFIKA